MRTSKGRRDFCLRWKFVVLPHGISWNAGIRICLDDCHAKTIKEKCLFALTMEKQSFSYTVCGVLYETMRKPLFLRLKIAWQVETIHKKVKIEWDRMIFILHEYRHIS